MASKCGAVSTTSYQKLSTNSTENGIANDVIVECDENFPEVFSDETEDVKSSDSSRENTLEKTASRKRSVLKKSDQRSKTGLQKRVSFSSVASERQRRVSNASDCFIYMQNGAEFLKVRPGGRQYQRFYQLNRDMDLLHWRPSSKKPEKAILPVELFYEIRAGKNTTIFKEQGSSFSEDCCFSLIVGPNYDSIDLVAKTSDEANIWITGLRLLNQKTESISMDDESDMREKWLKQQFRLIDKERIGALNEKSILFLLKKLRINAPQHIVKSKFLEVVSSSQCDVLNSIDENDFCQFFIDLTTRQEMYFLLVKYSSNGLYLTTDDLLIFLETEQGITWAGKEHSLDIINRCEPSEEGRNKQILGLDGLTKYFSEKDCNIFDPDHLKVCEDMKKPLSHYYIASSHNTYLLDDQLKGRSSVQGYVSSLQRGCRCVELDCWDGPNNEPIIYHGHTLTTKILFSDVLKAINDYAFISSDYPLILSLENHCSIKQQEVMAMYLKQIFKDSLYKSPVNESISYLPSPEFLKGKIIVKNKKLPRSSSSSVSEVGDVSEEEEEDQSNIIKNLENEKRNEGTDNIAFQKQLIQQQPQKSIRKASASEAQVTSSKMMKLAPDLSELVNLCKSVRFQSFQQSFDRQKYWEICSIGETSGRRLCQTCPEEFVSYNKKFLSRVYPAAKRMDSSNYNPVEFWNCGCQLVALNYQYPGLAMDLNRGRFLKNGQCGYTLKPSVMREEVAYFSPTMKNEIPGICPLTLQIKVISGFQLPKPRGSTSKGDALDPYVMVELYGIAADCHYERTRTIPHNGYNPVFDETFEFRIILPEIALLRFVVLDDDHIGDCFIGQFTIPVDCIRQGYRTVYLLSNMGENIAPASLFVHISFLPQSEMTLKNKGFSIPKSLKKKDYTSLKSLGMKVIDDTFKLSIHPLREATNLRDNFQISLNTFKDCCGLTPRANIKQCIRILASRLDHAVETSAVKVALKFSTEIPTLEKLGDPGHVLSKALDAFEDFLNESKTLLEHAGDVYERLSHARRSALEWHSDLRKKCAQEGFKEKRTHKVIENFSWNIKVLSGQADLLKTAKQHCEDYMRQIRDVSRTCSLGDENESNTAM